MVIRKSFLTTLAALLIGSESAEALEPKEPHVLVEHTYRTKIAPLLLTMPKPEHLPEHEYVTMLPRTVSGAMASVASLSLDFLPRYFVAGASGTTFSNSSLLPMGR